MVSSNFDPNDPRIELAVTKEKLRSLEDRLRQQEENARQLKLSLEVMTEERNKLRLELIKTQSQLTHVQELLSRSERKHARKTRKSKSRAFWASFLFLVASIVLGFAINQLTVAYSSTSGTPAPSGVPGWTMLGIAIAVHLSTAVLAIFLGDDDNE